jgi:endoglucanase
MFTRTLAAVLFLALAAASRGADSPLTPAEQVAQMKRGVNIVGYDPIWQDASKARFQPRHFKIIKDGGFNTVRVNLYGFRQMNAQLVLNPTWFATLDGLVNEAVKQGLHVILDMHDYERCFEDVARCRQQVLAFWEQVAAHYKDASNQVVFEILNEPNRAMNDHWNTLLVDALAVIRKANPTRNVLIGPAFWNNISWLEKFKLPANDRHIIVSVHYYEPHPFTHQGASWTPEYVNVSGIRWGTPADYAKIDKDFDLAQTWAKQHDRPVFLGEFGAYDKAPQEDRIKYTAAVARAAEQRGWAWGYWQFDSNFIVYDIGKDSWNQPIYRALVPATK